MTYLQQRVYNELGVPEELNKVLIHGEDRFGLPTDIEMPIFTSTKKDDIDILVYTLDRTLIEYDHPDATPEHKNINNDRKQHYHLTRLHPDRVKDGTKYIMPKGKGVYPFIPPMLLEAYEEHQELPVLYITEGYFKAFKASIHGLPIVGLSSITHYANSKTKKIHTAISNIIQECSVKHVVMLYDGDCLNISTKALTTGEDLAKRPQGFLSSMLQVRELLIEYDVQVWFSHINSQSLNNQPKGLDDLLVEYRDKEDAIIRSMLNLQVASTYVHRMNVSSNVKKLQPYFNLRSVDQFYGYWSELIGEREFCYYGSQYIWNAKENKVEKLLPKELKNYMRVGDKYWERVEMPVLYGANEFNIEGDTEITLQPRQKSTITDDYGKKALEKIPKYKAFINMPSHTNYQQVIKECWNQYSPIKHIPENGDWRTIEMLIRHIFGEQYQLGLDYLQILYLYPTQILPILCLVSQERQTGKTTFLDFLKMIYGDNCAKVGNDEISSQFNSFLAARLIVAVDETNLEKNRAITERIKMLSTTNRIFSQSKGVDQIEQWHFAKYILTSNFETNFIYTQEDEIRFWVRKVPHIDKVNPNLLQDLYDEIPAFLYYLSSRKISVPKTTRMWFDPADLETDALRKLKERQKPLKEREIRAWARELFYNFPDEDSIFVSIDVLKYYIPSIANEKDTNSIFTILKENMRLNRVDKVKRPRIPQWETTLGSGAQFKSCKNFDTARVYLLRREDVMTSKEIEELLLQEEEEEQAEKAEQQPTQTDIIF